jgi:hypothetical protein
MTNQNPWAVIVTGVIKLLGIMLLLSVVAAWWLAPFGGRALRRVTIAGRVPVGRLLRLLTGRWPAEEAINTPPTAYYLALLFWSILGVLIGGVLVLLGAPILSLLIGFLAGLLTGALGGLMKEPQPRRPQVLEDIFPEDSNPPGWRL